MKFIKYWKFSKVRNFSSVDVSLKLARILRAFRRRGHFAANLDPLKYLEVAGNERRTWWNSDEHKPDVEKFLNPKNSSKFDLDVFGLSGVDLNKEYFLGDEVRVHNKPYWSINSLVSSLKDAYCGSVGIEYSHLESDDQLFWLESKIEGEYGPLKWHAVSIDEIRNNINILLSTELTAKFFAEKYPSAKVFGIEGCESLIPGLSALIMEAAKHNVEGIEMGMAHRGRMNILTNVFKKSLRSICNQFNESEVDYNR